MYSGNYEGKMAKTELQVYFSWRYMSVGLFWKAEKGLLKYKLM